ncbi:MAG: ABC transporter substrate-binding protein [Candidatus Humimicrobiaceae bacterium]
MSKIKALVILGLIFALIVTMVIIPGCETTAAAETAAAAETTEKPLEKKFEGTTITIQTFLNPVGTTLREKALGAIIEDFKNKTGITVKTLLIPWNDNDAQLILSVQAGNPPDASWVRGELFNQDMKADSLMPLDSYIAKDFDEATIKDFLLWDQAGMSNGKKYALPFSMIAMGLFVRKDLLDKAGLKAPKTWQEFIEVGKALKSPGITPFLFGASSSQSAMISNFLQPMIENKGGKILDDAGMAAFDSQEGIETYEFLKSLVYEYEIAPKAAITTKYDDVNEAFGAGRVAMMIDGSHKYIKVIEKLGAEKVELVRIPGMEVDKPSSSSVTLWMIGIPKGSKNPDAAWEFIKYVNSVEARLKYTKISGELPTRQSVTEDAYFKSPEAAITNWWMEYLKYGNSIVVAPATMNELTEILISAIQETLASPDSDVKKILESAAKKYNDIVGKK